jgi:hypothetical protein
MSDTLCGGKECSIIVPKVIPWGGKGKVCVIEEADLLAIWPQNAIKEIPLGGGSRYTVWRITLTTKESNEEKLKKTIDIMWRKTGADREDEESES